MLIGDGHQHMDRHECWNSCCTLTASKVPLDQTQKNPPQTRQKDEGVETDKCRTASKNEEISSNKSPGKTIKYFCSVSQHLKNTYARTDRSNKNGTLTK